MKNSNKENNNTFRNTFRIDNRIRSMYNKTMRKTVDGLSVEWDECKNISNIKKHKLSFETAMLVFTDRNKVELYDFAHSKNEDRYSVIGMVNGIITVIYTERTKSIRIISARNATPAEKELYHGKNRKKNR